MTPNPKQHSKNETTGPWFDEADFLPTQGWTSAAIKSAIPKRQESLRAHLLHGVQPLALIFSSLPTIPCEVVDHVGVFRALSFDVATNQPVPERGIMHVENWCIRQQRGERIAAIVAAALERSAAHEEAPAPMEEADAL